MNLTLILASPNESSNSASLAAAFIEGVNKIEKTNTASVHLRNLDLENFTTKFYQDDVTQEPEFQEFQKIIEASDGIVIATPIWNFGTPGALKNLLDRMGSFALDKEARRKGQLRGLPFFLIFTGGAPRVAWQGLMHKTTGYVREGLKYFGCTFIGHLFEGGCKNTEKGEDPVVLSRPDSLERARKQGEAFGAIVKQYAQDGSLPSKYRRKNKIYRHLNTWISKLVRY